MSFEGKWLQNRLRDDKNESRSLLAVDIKGYQRGGFCIVPRKYIGELSKRLIILLETCKHDPSAKSFLVYSSSF